MKKNLSATSRVFQASSLGLLVSAIYSASLFQIMVHQASAADAPPLNSLIELPKPDILSPDRGAFYYEFDLPNGSRAHLVVAYLKSEKWRLCPVIMEKTTTTSEAAKSLGASAAVNGGYFNLSDGASASYVVRDRKTVADPRFNKALIDNPKLQPFLGQIFNRSEIRVLMRAGNKATEIQIAKHQDKVPAGMELIDSMQAGPRLLPTLDAEEEAFLRKQSDGTLADSIGCAKAAARTAFGTTAEGHCLFLAVSGKGQDRDSSGISLEELANLMKKLGCKQAINLDGGSSTSMYVKLNHHEGRSNGTVCAKDPETRVKSILTLIPQ